MAGPGAPEEELTLLVWDQREFDACDDSLERELAAHRQSIEGLLHDFEQRQRRILERWAPGRQPTACTPRSIAPDVAVCSAETFDDASEPLELTADKPVAEHASSASKLVTPCVAEVGLEKDAVEPRRRSVDNGQRHSVASIMDNSMESMVDRGKHVLGVHNVKEGRLKSVRATVHSMRTPRNSLTEVDVRRDCMAMIRGLVQSGVFDGLCVLVIVLNATFLGWQADYAFQHIGEPENPTVVAIELFFFLWYTVELVLRMIARGRRFVTESDCKWNLFDLLLVVQSLYEQVMRVVVESGGAVNMSFLRILRLMKMLKLLRIIRVMRSFKELRLVVNSILGGMKSMLWSSVLIFGTTYCFGIIFLQACTSHLEMTDSDDLRSSIDLYWSSVGTSMLTLYMASTAGVDWQEPAEPLRRVGALPYLVFLTYIGFFIFVIMNALTSLYVEATIVNAEKDQQTIIQEELEKKNVYINRLRQFYHEMDKDGDGDVSFDEFCKHLSAPEMHAFAQSLELDVTDVKQFFLILSSQGRHAVDLETFVVGCIKLKGMAKSMDLMDLAFSFRRFAETCMEVLHGLNERLDALGANSRLPSPKIAPPMAVQTTSPLPNGFLRTLGGEELASL